MTAPIQVQSLPGSLAPPPLISGVIAPSRFRSCLQLIRLDTKVVFTARRRIDNTPQQDDLYHIWIDGEFLDILAQKFYGDPSLWWIIADYNLITETRIVVPGMTLRYPSIQRVVLTILPQTP